MNRNDIIRQLQATSDKLAEETLYLRSFAAELSADRAVQKRDAAHFASLLDGYRAAILETPTYTDGGFHRSASAERERNLRDELLRMFTERP